MISGALFIFWRVVEVVFLIPPLGMLGWLVNGYMSDNALTPNMVLVLFIVVVLAFSWAVLTLVFFLLARHNGYLLAFVDLGLFAAFIAGVYEASNVTNVSCSNIDTRSAFYIQLGPFVYQAPQACSLIKASFAFGIIETMLFFLTFLLALWVHHHHKNDDEPTRETTYTRRSHHRSRAGSTVGSRSRRDDRSYRASSRTRSVRRSDV